MRISTQVVATASDDCQKWISYFKAHFPGRATENLKVARVLNNSSKT